MAGPPQVIIDNKPLTDGCIDVLGQRICWAGPPSFERDQFYEVIARGNVDDLIGSVVTVGGSVAGFAAAGCIASLWAGPFSCWGGAVVGAFIGLGVGLSADWAAKHYWTIGVFDRFPPDQSLDQMQQIMVVEAHEPSVEGRAQYKFTKTGEHSIFGGIRQLNTFQSSSENRVIIIPIPLFLPVTSDKCFILSPSHPNRTIMGQVKHDRTGALMSQPGSLMGLDYYVMPFGKDEAAKAREHDGIPYDPKTGLPNGAEGYNGRARDAINKNGMWSFEELYHPDPNDPTRRALPAYSVSYVSPKDIQEPDMSKWTFARARSIKDSTEEQVRMIVLPENTSYYYLSMGDLPVTWSVAVPLVVTGNIKTINDKMSECSEGDPARGIEVELLDGKDVVGKATSDDNGNVIFSFISLAEGNHKLQLRAKVPAMKDFSDIVMSDPKIVQLLGQSFWLSPWGLAIIAGVIVVGGVVIYNLTK